jgi:ABC-2 type transport system ATP-binding protein
MRTAVIEAAGISKTFYPKKLPPVAALQDVNLIARTGQLTALIGPDGAGKTTFMRLLCGLMKADAGTLHVVGLDVAERPQAVQDELSYMPQKFGLYEDLTVQENLDLYADLHGITAAQRQERFARLLEMTGLTPFIGRLAGKLSGGMKQKLGLACTLVRSPKLLLLDEPTAGVDPLSRRELWEILQRLVQEEHLSVLVSTAYMEEASLCQDVYVLNRGRMLAAGTPEHLCRLAEGRCFSVLSPASFSLRILQSELLRDPCVTDAVPVGGRVRVITTTPAAVPAILKEHGWKKEPVAPRLEDAFMILLHQDAAQERQAVPGLSRTDGLVVDPLTQPVDIEARDLVRTFGDFVAVRHTSFQVHRGEVFGLLGPNGAGKTTTFRMLCGLLPATSGYLSVAGVNLRKARTQARANIGYVAQKFSLYGSLTVYENLRFFGGIYGLTRRQLERRITAVMEEFQLTEKADYVAERLPGGYKQRLSMAAALLHKPKILFLDEPTSGIDPLARRQFWQQITRLSAQGTTIIITTHFMDEAEYCDRIMIQDKGALLVLGRPDEIREKLHLPGADMNAVFIAIVEQARQKGNEGI